MDTSDYLIIAMLAVLLLYGLGNYIAAPILMRRFYRDKLFTDQGPSALESPAESQVLQPLATSNLYKGQHQNRTLEQCKAYPQSRRTFTLSKARRKHNQTRWSVTRLGSEQQLEPFCLLPTADVSTALMMLNDPGVDISEDKEFAHRYHLRCANPERVKLLIFNQMREFLLQKELISVECLDNTLIIKRSWPQEKISKRLLDEINCAVQTISWLEDNSPAG